MTAAAMDRDHERRTDRLDRRILLAFLVACGLVSVMLFGIYAAGDIRHRAIIETEERHARDCDIKGAFRVKERAYTCERLKPQ